MLLAWAENTHVPGLLCMELMELGQLHGVNEQCERGTRDHAVQALDVLLGYAAFCAHFVDEAGNEPDHRVGHVAVLRVFKPALRVEALRNAAGDAAKHRMHHDAIKKRGRSQATEDEDLI